MIDDTQQSIRLGELAAVLCPNSDAAPGIVARAINDAEGTSVSFRADHADRSLKSARDKAADRVRNEGGSATQPAPSAPRKSDQRHPAFMDYGWRSHLAVLEHATKQYELSPQCAAMSGTGVAFTRDAAVFRYVAMLVIISMKFQGNAVRCLGRWLYSCDKSPPFIEEHQRRNVDKKVEERVSKLFSASPVLLNVDDDDDVRAAMQRLLSFLSPKSGSVHGPVLTALADLAVCPTGEGNRGQLVQRILSATDLTWRNGSRKVALKGDDYVCDQEREGEHPEYLRSEVLIDPLYDAFRYCLGEPPEWSKRKTTRRWPRLPVWTIMNDDDSQSSPPDGGGPKFVFDGPPEIGQDFLLAVEKELARQHERSRDYRLQPDAAPVIHVDSDPLVLEPDDTYDGESRVGRGWRAAIPADAERLWVYGEEDAGSFLIGTVALPDLQAVGPGQVLSLSVSEHSGPAFFFQLSDDAGDEAGTGEEPGYVLYIDYVPDMVAEPIVLSECRLRGSVDDPLYPWFDLACPVYPYLTLRLHFDRKEGVVQLRSPNNSLPSVYCTDEHAEALISVPGGRGESRFAVPRRGVPALAEALGLPASYHSWVDSEGNAPTAEGLLARMRQRAGAMSGSLRLVQNAILAALIERGDGGTGDPWASLRGLQALFPAHAARGRNVGEGPSDPWPAVLVALTTKEPADGLTFTVTWSDPPEELPEVEMYLDDERLHAVAERRNGRDIVHVSGEPLLDISDLSSPPDWELAWDWRPNILILRLYRGVDFGG